MNLSQPLSPRSICRIAFGRNRRAVFAALLVIVTGAGIAAAAQLPEGADCLAQPRPGGVPRLFAPGIVNTGMVTRDVAITPDGREFYFSMVAAGYSHGVICVSRWTAGGWSEPEIAPFSGSTEWVDLEPSISPDGQRFFFYSTRPSSPGSDGDQDLWLMDRVGDGWSEPRPVGAPVNSDAPEFFPSTDRDGTLYFCRADPETRVETVMAARRAGEGYAEPEALPELIQAGRNRFNSWVLPDGDRILVPVAGHPENHSGVDYWLGWRDEAGQWSSLANLGAWINAESGRSWSASVSPDGEFLFFMSSRPVGGDPAWPQDWTTLQRRHRSAGQGRAGIWWVEADFLDGLTAGQAPPELPEAPQGDDAPAMAEAPAFPVLSGPYLGQTPPGREPEPFAPGVVSTGLLERDLAISPDGGRIVFGLMDLGLVTLLESRLVDGRWSEPRTAGFHNDPDFACLEPAFSADGRTVMFLSNRAAPGQEQGRGWANQNIFSSRLVDGEWTEPEALPAPVTTDGAEYYPSLASDGTLYFSRQNAERHTALWTSEPLPDGGWDEPVRLPDEVNVGTDTYNAFVAPDESWIIACVGGHEENLGGADYWISFRGAAGQWLPAVNLGERFNGPDLRASSASLSPDGRMLFFATTRPDPGLEPLPERWTRAALLERHALHGTGSSDIWWVDAGILEEYRPEE